jgi:hypothetical protein
MREGVITMSRRELERLQRGQNTLASHEGRVSIALSALFRKLHDRAGLDTNTNHACAPAGLSTCTRRMDRRASRLSMMFFSAIRSPKPIKAPGGRTASRKPR